MAKIYGLFGAMTGKVADVVMVVRNGVQVARKYQPVVSNPSTPAQVAARAKLKLMSQLGEVLSKGIAFTRQGIVSARNRFVSANYAISSFDTENQRAEIDLLNVKLTPGVMGIPPITLTRTTGKVVAMLSEGAVFDAVVYVVVQRQGDGNLRFITAEQVTEAGANFQFQSSEIPFASALTGVVYAYGIRFNSETARAKYASLLAENSEGYLSVIRTASEADYSVSETVASAITVVA